MIDLLGNAWRFPAGHSLRMELAQDDDPTIRFSATPSSLVLAGGRVELPIREPSTTLALADAVERRRARPRRRGRSGDDSSPAGGVRSAAAGDLPFTGFQLLPVFALGVALLGTGAAMRRGLRTR